MRDTISSRPRWQVTWARTSALAALGSLAALLTSCSPRSTSAAAAASALSEADRTSIRSLDSIFVDGWLRDDTTAVLSVFSADAMLLPPGSHPVAGLSAIRSYWWPQDGSHTRITAFHRAIEEIEGSRTLAYVRGSAELGWTYVKDGKSSQQTSRSSDLQLYAQDSARKWHIVRQMWNVLPP